MDQAGLGNLPSGFCLASFYKALLLHKMMETFLKERSDHA